MISYTFVTLVKAQVSDYAMRGTRLFKLPLSSLDKTGRFSLTVGTMFFDRNNVLCEKEKRFLDSFF